MNLLFIVVFCKSNKLLSANFTIQYESYKFLSTLLRSYGIKCFEYLIPYLINSDFLSTLFYA